MMMIICLFMPPVISVFLLEKAIFKQAYDWAKRIYSYIFSFLFTNTLSLMFFSLSYDYTSVRLNEKDWRWKSITFNKTETCVKYLILAIVLSLLAPFIYKLIVKYIEAAKESNSRK